ncbi:MAG: hypothetical protein C0622_02270 [Desulfuromonas sp.]|nr:MAG: hypothetical protein C0622_02270 [Desulfuromonas sp.]
MERLIEKAKSVRYDMADVLSVAILLLFMLLGSRAEAAHRHPEKHYQQQWCDAAGGVTEFVLQDRTRVDCLLDEYAIEFDFANKWAEAIGQALYYGQMTDSRPGVVLILESTDDRRYLERLHVVADQYGIRVWTVGQGAE